VDPETVSTDRLNTHPVPSPSGMPTPSPTRCVVVPPTLCRVILTVPLRVVLKDRDVAPLVATVLDQVTSCTLTVVGVVGGLVFAATGHSKGGDDHKTED
jgi:hypothetical protein